MKSGTDTSLSFTWRGDSEFIENNGIQLSEHGKSLVPGMVIENGAQ